MAPSNWESLIFFNEYKYSDEDTKDIPIKNINKLGRYEKEICNNCFKNNKLLYNTNTNLSFFQGVFGKYEGGSYYFDINPNKFNKTEFDSLLEVIGDVIKKPNSRMLYINMNILNRPVTNHGIGGVKGL